MLEVWFLLLVAGAFFLGGIVKGTIGLGLPLVAIGFMSSIITVPETLPIAAIPILAANGWQALQGLHWKVVFRRLFLLNLACCIGIAFGSSLLFEIDPDIIGLMMGILLVVYVLLNLVTVDFRIPANKEAILSPPVGLCGGVLFGMTGSLVIPVLPYLQALNLQKDDFVQAVGMVFFITAIAFFAGLAANGAFTWTNLAIGGGALVPSGLGMAIGVAIRSRISQERFRHVVFFCIFLLGLNLIRQALL
jgi:uncharacterized membrane protein YfcA